MQPSYIKTLFIVAFTVLIIGCASDPYRVKQGDTPEGFSFQKLSPTQYTASYESYRDIDRKQLESLAKKGAEKLSQKEEWASFQIVDIDYEEFEKTQEVPEQVIMVTNTNHYIGFIAGVEQLETTIPAHFKQFTIRKVNLSIEVVK